MWRQAINAEHRPCLPTHLPGTPTDPHTHCWTCHACRPRSPSSMGMVRSSNRHAMSDTCTKRQQAHGYSAASNHRRGAPALHTLLASAPHRSGSGENGIGNVIECAAARVHRAVSICCCVAFKVRRNAQAAVCSSVGRHDTSG